MTGRIKPALKQRELEPNKQDSTNIADTLSFNELVIGDSLPLAEIRITPFKKPGPNASDNNLLTELQCEV